MNMAIPVKLKSLSHASGFIILSLISIAIWAQTNGLTTLPNLYRTSLSDIVFDNNKQWRIAAEQDNPWRADEKHSVTKPRFKATLFPEYDYHTVDDPTTRSLLQNENELERPRTNIFKYTF
ncbi:MAG: hypothetical protein JKX75_00015 [Gammaproteobacteria bacterium]|nr:hypothetical protein [Gammaproteobacteria bacterium]